MSDDGRKAHTKTVLVIGTFAVALAFLYVLSFQLDLSADKLFASKPKPLSVELKPFSVRLVDASGKPVEGAELGILASAGDYIREQPAKRKTEWLYNMHTRSDENGVAHFSDGRGELDRLCLIARHEGRKIGAVASLDPNESAPIQLILMPETQVVGRAVCKQLADLKRELGLIIVYVRFGGKTMLECRFSEPTYYLALPPGNYEIEIYGSNVDRARTSIKVDAQSSVQQIAPLHLPASKLALLEGYEAPEIVDVVAWKNSKRISLKDLRGKCVLLEFWGHWCGPCVQQMPEIFNLHDKYASQGLVVIGIHVDFSTDPWQRVDTSAMLDDQLLKTRKELWGGRDVPFPVAMVTSERAFNSQGESIRTVNQTVANYGIHRYPTQVLIDRRGNVVKSFSPNAEGMALLEKVLREE